MGLLLRRGLEADRLSFTPAEGELIYVTDTKLIYVGDGVTAGGILVAGGTTPPTTPTYALSRSSATVNEGGTVTVTLTTTNVSNGTAVPYTSTGTGITAGDLGLSSLTGSFTVNSNTASLVLNITADITTEGSETFTVTLNSITPTTSVSVTINDTSPAPSTPSYSLSRSSSSITEGSFFTITLTTTNVANGTNVPYTITGVSSADIDGDSLTGNFTINANTDSIIFSVADDGVTEGVETFTITLNGITPINSISVSISDPVIGDIDGGTPSTPSFESIIEGGGPGTISFDEIIDGGTV
jgi:hypothetical protein